MASRSRQHLQVDFGWLPDSSIQQRLVARAADIGKRWPELPAARKRAVLTALIERIEVSLDQIDIRLRPPRLNALLDAAATSQGTTDDETEILSVPVRLRRAGRQIRMVIDGTDPFDAVKPDARSIKLLLRARWFKATLPLRRRHPLCRPRPAGRGVSRSYFSRLVRLSYLAPDITQAILDGRQPCDLTAEKLLEHLRLPLA